eukprot:108720-Chlamydomonas_euryale.AAC.1
MSCGSTASHAPVGTLPDSVFIRLITFKRASERYQEGVTKRVWKQSKIKRQTGPTASSLG